MLVSLFICGVASSVWKYEVFVHLFKDKELPYFGKQSLYFGVGVMVGQVLANTCFPVDQSHVAHKLNGVQSSHHSPLHYANLFFLSCVLYENATQMCLMMHFIELHNLQQCLTHVFMHTWKKLFPSGMIHILLDSRVGCDWCPTLHTNTPGGVQKLRNLYQFVHSDVILDKFFNKHLV